MDNSYIANPKRVSVMRKIAQSGAVRQRLLDKTLERLRAEMKLDHPTSEMQGQTNAADEATDDEKFLNDFG